MGAAQSGAHLKCFVLDNKFINGIFQVTKMHFVMNIQ